MNVAEYPFNVLVEDTVHAQAKTPAEALTRAKGLAQSTQRAAFVRNAHGIVYSVTPAGLVAVCVDVGPPDREMPGRASWPTTHPLTGTRIASYESVGAVPKLEFIFKTEDGDAYLRGMWNGESWTWDEDLWSAKDILEERDKDH